MKKVFFAVLLSTAFGASAQIIECYPTESFWAVSNEGTSYAMLLNDTAKQNSANQITYRNTLIEYEFVAANNKGQNDEEVNMLINYMTETASKNTEANTTINSRTRKTENGMVILSILLPATESKKAQVILATPINGKLLTISTDVTNEAKMNETAALLEDLIVSVRKFESKDDLCSK